MDVNDVGIGVPVRLVNGRVAGPTDGTEGFITKVIIATEGMGWHPDDPQIMVQFPEVSQPLSYWAYELELVNE